MPVAVLVFASESDLDTFLAALPPKGGAEMGFFDGCGLSVAERLVDWWLKTRKPTQLSPATDGTPTVLDVGNAAEYLRPALVPLPEEDGEDGGDGGEDTALWSEEYGGSD